MMYIAVSNMSSYSLIKKRTAKPFNPLLGETFELVTPKYRFVSEQVSHHPPVCAFSCQGNNWEMIKSVETQIKFNGRQVVIADLCPTYLDLTPDFGEGNEA
jgi:hypothetical protein